MKTAAKKLRLMLCIFIAMFMIFSLPGCAAQTAAAITHQPSEISPAVTEPASTALSPGQEAAITPSPEISPSPVSSAEREDSSVQRPLLYEKNENVYMVSGTDSICLGTTKELYTYNNDLNALFSQNNGYLYYIAYGGRENEGILFRVKTDAKTKPEKVMEDVCVAKPSGDGQKVLYFTGIKGTSGNLYLLEAPGESEFIADNVVPVYYGFSPKGECIYYLRQENDGVTLYEKKGNKAPEAVTHIDQKPVMETSSWVSFYGIQYIEAGDDGHVLCQLSGTLFEDFVTGGLDTGDIFYYSPGGKFEMLTPSGGINDYGGALIKTLGRPDEILYRTNNEVYYKAPGKEPALLDDNAGGAVFAYSDSSYGITGTQMDKRFLIAHYKGTVDEDTGWPEYTLYEYEIGKGKTPVGWTDDYDSIMVGPDFDYVIYNRDDEAYIARKKGGNWEEKKLAFGTIQCIDYQDKDIYLIGDRAQSESDDFYGALYRYSINTDRKVKLADNVTTCELFGDDIYAIKTDGTACRFDGNKETEIIKNASEMRLFDNIIYVMDIDGGVYRIENYKAVKLASDVRAWGDIYDTGNGVYIDTKGNDIYYAANDSDKAKLICKSVWEIDIFYEMWYFPPAADIPK